MALKLTTKSKDSDAVTDNLLNQNFSPVAPNHVWADDVTYCRAGEVLLYLAIVIDLYSRHVVGWAIDKTMTTSMVLRVLVLVYK